MDQKFQKIKEAVEKELSCSAHNMDHVMRVYNLSLQLAKDEDIDLDVLKASVLLHDIARVKEDNDHTGKTDHAILSSKMAVPILKELEFSADKIKHIQDCIISHRYRTENEPKTKEAQILFDADKLDAIGAIGIGRAFIFAGANGAKLHNKEVDIEKNEEYTEEDTAFREFMVKLKKVKDRMLTEEGKKIAEERHNFMIEFFNRLNEEVDGNI